MIEKNKPLAQRKYDLIPSDDNCSSDQQLNIRNKKKKIKKEKKEKNKKDKKIKIHYGKYGLISIADMGIKRDEFVLWLSDIKKICIDNISNVEERKYFEQYAEDYNTCSFPNKKYYDLDKWMNQQKTSQENEVIQQNKFFTLSDEQQKLKDKQQQRDLIRQFQINDALYNLSNTSDMANKMMEQQKLKDIMVHHYKMGNISEAKRIQHMLDGNKKEVNIKIDDDDPDVFE